MYAENVFVTFYKSHNISIGIGEFAGKGFGKTTPTVRPKTDPNSDRNVGKWKVRKKVVGGADAAKVKIVGGEPAAKGEQKYFSIAYSRKTGNVGEGYLAFVKCA